MSARERASRGGAHAFEIFRSPRAGLAAALRLALALAVATLFWLGFSAPYERAVAGVAQAVLRAFERPPVTRLEPGAREVVVRRSDFPPGAGTTGLPAADLHANFVLLAALFALHPRPLRGDRVVVFLVGCLVLAAVHVAALALEVRSLYATRLGAWSLAHYGPVARNVWGAAFHFYLVAGRFAAPFMIWWPVAGLGVGERRRERAPGRRRATSAAS